VPDPQRLGLALRYQGSASRELFHSLRALHELRHRPLGPPQSEALVPDQAAEPGPESIEANAAATPAGPPALSAGGERELPAVAEIAWGGGRPPPMPPGCLMLRPVPGIAPEHWRWYQGRAYPGAEPVPVDAEGIAYVVRDGAWVPAPAPATTPAPRAETATPAWTPPPPPAGPGTLRHGLTPELLGSPLSAAEDAAPPPALPARTPVTPSHDDPQRRNEPSMPAADIAPAAPLPVSVAADESPAAPAPACDEAVDRRAVEAPDVARSGGWERVWGLVPPEPLAHPPDTAGAPPPRAEITLSSPDAFPPATDPAIAGEVAAATATGATRSTAASLRRHVARRLTARPLWQGSSGGMRGRDG
jgi:hypothetical protein